MFDYFGTLTPGLASGRVAESMSRVATALDVDPIRFGAEMKASWVERSTGALGDSLTTLAEIGRRCDPGPAFDLDAAHSLRMRDFADMAALRPVAARVLTDLSSMVGLAVVSDCPPELVELWATLPVSALVDVAVLSAREGVKKPAPAMFLRAATRLDVEPAACLYVGDGGSDELSGAQAVGMKAVRIVGEGDLYVHDMEEGSDHPEITTLTEVASIIERV